MPYFHNATVAASCMSTRHSITLVDRRQYNTARYLSNQTIAGWRSRCNGNRLDAGYRFTLCAAHSIDNCVVRKICCINPAGFAYATNIIARPKYREKIIDGHHSQVVVCALARDKHHLVGDQATLQSSSNEARHKQMPAFACSDQLRILASSCGSCPRYLGSH